MLSTPMFSCNTDVSATSSLPVPPQAESVPSRRFRPEESYPEHFSLSDIEVPSGDMVFLACPGSERKCPHCGYHAHHSGSIVIAIDGACRNNGKSGARASIGVYHGPDHGWNGSARLSMELRQTNHVAELAACERALTDAWTIQKEWDDIGEEIEGDKGRLYRVVIKSDSEYVVRGMTEWIYKWKANGWVNTKGLPVTNREHFDRVDSIVESLEKEQVIVQFWHVPREYNQEADKLATSALDGN
ncbi:hypothetical protein AtubIFM54640_001367 [Aspergillus tubingensis]|uniref:ribonuclease H n=1 Tax=Aspergillus niger TaxID=5061 RepID=A0A100IMM0_ASPNG|nr:hypothetical protein AKAW_10100 [Aspergillus niger]GLA60869.1 hypothetical protein AtubIFM54640_001367 [Aspergillus tubingensis]